MRSGLAGRAWLQALSTEWQWQALHRVHAEGVVAAGLQCLDEAGGRRPMLCGLACSDEHWASRWRGIADGRSALRRRWPSRDGGAQRAQMVVRQRGRGEAARGDPSKGSWCGVRGGIGAGGWWPEQGTGVGDWGFFSPDVRTQPQREVEADRWAAMARGAHLAVVHRERVGGAGL
jgi:hypothetical protein